MSTIEYPYEIAEMHGDIIRAARILDEMIGGKEIAQIQHATDSIAIAKAIVSLKAAIQRLDARNELREQARSADQHFKKRGPFMIKWTPEQLERTREAAQEMAELLRTVDYPPEFVSNRWYAAVRAILERIEGDGT